MDLASSRIEAKITGRQRHLHLLVKRFRKRHFLFLSWLSFIVWNAVEQDGDNVGGPSLLRKAPNLVIYVLALACLRRANDYQIRRIFQMLIEFLVIPAKFEIILIAEDAKASLRRLKVFRRL